jgi:hypothetical protein
MSIISTDELRARVETDLEEAALQDLIDGEEGWLAAELKGPLTGERTQTLWPRQAAPDDAAWRSGVILTQPLVWPAPNGPLWLLRPTDEVEVTDAGAAVTVRLLHSGWQIELSDSDASWEGPVVATYEPNDLDLVRRAVAGLCQITLADQGYVSQRFGNYNYQRFQNPGADVEQRAAWVRTLKPRIRAGSIGLRSAMLGDRIAVES